MTDDYQPVLTDDGFEIRDPEGNAVWQSNGGWEYPPSEEALEEIFEYENVNTEMKRVLRLMVGIPEIEDER